MSIYTQVLINSGRVELFKRSLEAENGFQNDFEMISPAIGVTVALLHVHGGVTTLTDCLSNIINRVCDVYGEDMYIVTDYGYITQELVYSLDMLCLSGYEGVIIDELLEDIKISALSSSSRHLVKPSFYI